MAAAPRWIPALVALALIGSGYARGEVTVQSREGFVVTHELVLEAPPLLAYRTLTRKVSEWWDADHSYSGNAENFILEDRAGGCFCERLPGGGSVEHMRVVFASPGKRLRMVGGLGPLQEMGASAVMDFAFAPEGEDRTRLTFRYTVGGFVPGGLGAMAEPVGSVLGGQLGRLAAYLQGGNL